MGLLFSRSSSKKKHHGTPDNWPNSTAAQLAQLPLRHLLINQEQEYLYVDNSVKTSKYELYNFLPKFLMEEFNPRVKIANCYFLAISCLQCFTAISNTSGYPTTLIPLFFVVLVNGIFQLLEDFSRRRADKEANSSTCLRLSTARAFEPTLWSELVVGDFVKLLSHDRIPADILILSVAEKEGSPSAGLCFVETKSLDGETNLKIRNAMPNTFTMVRASFHS